MNVQEMAELLRSANVGSREKIIPWWEKDADNPMYRYNRFKEEEKKGVAECVAACPVEALTEKVDGTGVTLFHLLMMSGFYQEAVVALDRGVDVDVPGTGCCGGLTPLMAVCSRGNEKMVRLLLDRGADSSRCDDEGRNAFHYLAGAGIYNISFVIEGRSKTMPQRENIARLLTGDINARDAQGRTPLEMMLQSTNTRFSCALAEVYIEKGADILSVDEEGNSLLITAVKNRHQTAALALMKEDSLINKPGSQGKTPLHVAVQTYGRGLCVALLDRHADRNIPDAEGKTPADLAREEYDKEIKQLFSPGGLKIDHLDNLATHSFFECTEEEKDALSMGLYLAEKLIREVDTDDDEEINAVLGILQSALREDENCRVLDMVARAGIDMTAPLYVGSGVECIRDHCLSAGYGVKVIRKFMELGVDMNQAVLKGRTPANIVASQEPRTCFLGEKDTYQEEAARLFSRESMEQVDDQGTAAIHQAVRHNYAEMLQVMIEKGVDVNLAQDEPAEAGNTPLHVAATWGSGECVKLLMAAGADDSLQNVKGETPAHLAVKERRYGGGMKVEERLSVLENLKHVDVAAGDGSTPLILLQQLDFSTRTELLPVLLEKGADVNHADNQGNTALHMACGYQCYKQIVKELIRAGADVNAANRNGDIPLHYVLRYGGQDSAVFMIKKGADYNRANNAGVTPAQIAAEKGYDTVLGLMTDIR